MEAETTLCTAIEAGALEEQVLLLAASLRSFGGARKDMPLVAVRPRAGPPISRSTKKQLADLDVALVEKNLSGDYAWWAMYNKPMALAYVEDNARTPNVTWIDGDMLILREPLSFAPPPGHDFIGRAGEAHDVASNGHDDRAEFWVRLCEKLGIDFQNFPEVISFPDKKPIKAYWQGGLLTYRRDTRWSQAFRKVYETLLDGDIASKHAGTYHTDQVSVALAVQTAGMRAAHYDPRMNFNVNVLDKASSALMPINDVLIMQYHGSLWPEHYGWTKSVVAPLPQDRKALLDRYAPFAGGGRLLKFQRKLYQLARDPKIKAYEARAVRY